MTDINNGCGGSDGGVDYPEFDDGNGLNFQDQIYITYQANHAPTKLCVNDTEYCAAFFDPQTRDIVIYQNYGPDGHTLWR